jgi:hypothetical protein
MASQTTNFEHIRKHPRILFHLTPWVFSLTQKNTPTLETPLRLEARNVSLGGLKFFSNYKFPLFEKLQIALFEKGSRGDPIELKGHIVRVEETDTGQAEKIYGLAIEFQSVESADLQRLTKGLPRPGPT